MFTAKPIDRCSIGVQRDADPGTDYVGFEDGEPKEEFSHRDGKTWVREYGADRSTPFRPLCNGYSTRNFSPSSFDRGSAGISIESVLAERDRLREENKNLKQIVENINKNLRHLRDSLAALVQTAEAFAWKLKKFDYRSEDR